MRNSKLQYIFLVSKHADQEQALQAYWHVQILCCLAISHLTKPPKSKTVSQDIIINMDPNRPERLNGPRVDYVPDHEGYTRTLSRVLSGS
jgi:hypothetical protein